MKIAYKNEKIKKACSDLIVAKQKYNDVAEKLFSLINFIENAMSLRDIAAVPSYKLHPLKGKRSGQFALDIKGRKSKWRLIIVPLNADGEKFKTKDNGVIYSEAQIIEIREVSDHYE